MSISNKCIVCDGVFIEPLYQGILQCQGCGHVFADLRLTDKELFELYDEQYFRGEEYWDYASDKRIIQKNFRLRYDVLRSFLEPDRHQSLFEIGSAYGFFLDVVRNDFQSVQGIDITESGTRYAREQLNLNVAQGDLLQYDLGNQKFDVVCMWDTIEHLHSPHLYIEKASEHLESGALLAVTTGDIESLNARIRKDKWRLIHPPTHVHYFSAKTLARMLNNYGFEVIYNRYCGFYRSVENIAYNILVLRQGKRRLFDLLQKTGIANFDLYLNLYDIMYVIARKR